MDQTRILLIAVVALSLAACGGDGESNSAQQEVLETNGTVEQVDAYGRTEGVGSARLRVDEVDLGKKSGCNSGWGGNVCRKLADAVSTAGGDIKVEFIADRIKDNRLYQITMDCSQGSDAERAVCNKSLSRPLHAVMTGAQFKAGGWHINTYTELFYGWLKFHVLAGFTVDETAEFIDALVAMAFSRDNQSYEKLLTTAAVDLPSLLRNPQLIDEFLGVASSPNTTPAQLQEQATRVAGVLLAGVKIGEIAYPDSNPDAFGRVFFDDRHRPFLLRYDDSAYPGFEDGLLFFYGHRSGADDDDSGYAFDSGPLVLRVYDIADPSAVGELTEPQEDCPTKPLANVYPDNDGNFSELKPCNQPRGITLARMHGISPDSMADTANTARSFGEGAALHAKTFELHDGLALVADGATLKIFDVRSTLASELTRAESVDSANAVIGTAAEAQPVAELTLVSGGGQVEALTVATGTSGEQRVWLLLSTDEVVEVRIPANPAFAVESFRQSLPPLPSVEEGTSVDYAALAVRLDAQAGDRLYVLKASSDRSLSSIETFDLSAGLSLRGSTGLDQGFFTTRSFNNVVRLVAQQDSLYLPLNGGDPVVRVFALTGDGGLLDELKLKGRISIQNRLNDFDVNQRGQLFAGRRAKGTPIYAADAVVQPVVLSDSGINNSELGTNGLEYLNGRLAVAGQSSLSVFSVRETDEQQLDYTPVGEINWPEDDKLTVRDLDAAVVPALGGDVVAVIREEQNLRWPQAKIEASEGTLSLIRLTADGPQIVDEFPMEGAPGGVALHDNLALVAGAFNDGGLKIFNLESGAQRTVVLSLPGGDRVYGLPDLYHSPERQAQNIDPLGPGEAEGKDVVAVDGTAYVTARLGDCSDPRTGRFDCRYSVYYLVAVDIDSGRVLDSHRIHYQDFRENGLPRVQAAAYTVTQAGITVNKVAAYVATQDGLQVFDVSDRANIRQDDSLFAGEPDLGGALRSNGFISQLRMIGSQLYFRSLLDQGFPNQVNSSAIYFAQIGGSDTVTPQVIANYDNGALFGGPLVVGQVGANNYLFGVNAEGVHVTRAPTFGQ